jgi:DNA-binding NtrC family response regulator
MDKPVTILVIEDEQMIRDVYETVFATIGHAPIFSLDMEEIRELIPRVELVLCDYNMGLDFNVIAGIAREFKKPFLAVTANPDRVHENQLSKPFTLEALLNQIDTVLNR